jgi:hypothetical protein
MMGIIAAIHVRPGIILIGIRKLPIWFVKWIPPTIAALTAMIVSAKRDGITENVKTASAN